jgi:hypothetical protein
MRKILLGIAALATASASQAAITFDFTSPSGDVGSFTHVYSSGGYSLTAYGCSNLVSLVCTGTDLYGKSEGDDETGLGLIGDPLGNNEIWYAGNGTVPAIVLDVTDILAAGSAQFTIESVTGGEVWNLLGWNGTSWVSLITDSNADQVAQSLPGFGSYNLYAFTSGGTITPGVEGRTPGNILLGSIILPSVPEPATWGLMMLGFAGIGFAMRRRRRPAIAQVA